MSVQVEVMSKLKEAMKSKDTVALSALRALKSAFMLAKTEVGSEEGLSGEQELKIIQKQVKQRKDSAKVFSEQDREDLATPELEEAKVLEQFLPKPLTQEEVENIVESVIKDLNANGMKDMGKVMGIVSKKVAGKADGKTISTIVKQKLS